MSEINNVIFESRDGFAQFFDSDLFLIDQKQNKENADTNTIGYYGGNKKNILFLLDHHDEKLMPEDERNILQKILKALGLDFEDVAIINIARQKEKSFSSFKEFLSINKAVLLGIEPNELGMKSSCELYKVNNYNNTQLLSAEKLVSIVSDEGKKRLFWDSLKILVSSPSIN